jgi:hypothetical protein
LGLALVVIKANLPGSGEPGIYFSIGFLSNIFLQWIIDSSLKVLNIGKPKQNDLPLQYSSIAASRLGLKSVAYGWFDPSSGAINVGVSPDGIHFPATKTIATDRSTRYGPAVAIFGKYLVVTYQTTNRQIAPVGAPPGSYVAWLESTDGGSTWSRPEALFGRDAKSLPKFKTQVKMAKGNALRSISLAGIPEDLAIASQVLVWEAGTISASRVFVTSAMSYKIPGASEKGVRTIGIVSSKLPRKGGNWTHVVANSMTKAALQDLPEAAPNGIFHQYSALPGTPLRVVSYVNHDQATGEESLVAAISTDNAKHFVRTVRYKATDLGFSKDAHLALRSSLCLWRGADGSVSLDTFLASETTGNDRLLHVKIPIGIRLKGGEVVSASNW